MLFEIFSDPAANLGSCEQMPCDRIGVVIIGYSCTCAEHAASAGDFIYIYPL